MERCVESILERRHGELNNAGIDLADERADADRTDHHPRVGGALFKKPRGSGFREIQTPVQVRIPPHSAMLESAETRLRRSQTRLSGRPQSAGFCGDGPPISSGR